MNDALGIGDLDAISLKGVPDISHDLTFNAFAVGVISQIELKLVGDAGFLEFCDIADRCRIGYHAGNGQRGLREDLFHLHGGVCIICFDEDGTAAQAFRAAMVDDFGLGDDVIGEHDVIEGARSDRDVIKGEVGHDTFFVHQGDPVADVDHAAELDARSNARDDILE